MRHPCILLRAITWWRIGAMLHFVWLLLLCFGLALVTPLANWFRAHHPSPLPGSSAEALAGNLLLRAILVIFASGMVVLGLAAVLQCRENRLASRIKRGLCPACAYLVGESSVCTECGAAVVRRAEA